MTGNDKILEYLSDRLIIQLNFRLDCIIKSVIREERKFDESRVDIS